MYLNVLIDIEDININSKNLNYRLFNSIFHAYKTNYYSYQKMVKIRFVHLFETNNFVPQHLFCMSQSLSEKFNF